MILRNDDVSTVSLVKILKSLQVSFSEIEIKEINKYRLIAVHFISCQFAILLVFHHSHDFARL